MDVRTGFIDSIGHTPLIKLRAASEATGCNIYGKAEFLNPGGSVKDRAALAIIEDAEKRGLLKPGGVIVAADFFVVADGTKRTPSRRVGSPESRDASPGPVPRTLGLACAVATTRARALGRPGWRPPPLTC